MSKIVDWDARIGGRVRLRDLHILLAVVQCGSMAKAAEQLGVSQPAVSEAIAGLEHALNVRLLERGRRGVEPTAFGHALLKSGRAAFDELRQGIKQIELLSDPDAGDVRIACPESISSGILGPIITLMSKRYPRVRLFVEPFLFNARPLFPQVGQSRSRSRVDATVGSAEASDDYAVEILSTIEFESRLASIDRGPGVARLTWPSWSTSHGSRFQPMTSGARSSSTRFVPMGWMRLKFRSRRFPFICATASRSARGSSPRFRSRYFASNNEYLQELPIDLPEPPWPALMITSKKRALGSATARFMECAREVAKSLRDASRGSSTHTSRRNKPRRAIRA